MNGRKKAFFLATLLILASVVTVLLPILITASADTLTIRPNSSGSFTEWTPYPAATPNWQCVDEEVQNGDTDYVYAPGKGLADSYNLQNTTQTGSISNVRIGTYAKQTTGNEKLKQILVIGGVTYYGAVDHTPPATTYTLYTNDWATNPATNSSWTWSDINSLEAGLESKAVAKWEGEIRVTQLYVEITYTPPVRDVAVIDVTPSPTTVSPGQLVNITVVVKNNGSVTETFNVTSYYDSTSIETQNVTDLAPGANTTLLFVWNTTGVAEGNYTIKAEASVVPGETNTANNTFIDDIVTITAVVRDVAVIDVTPSLTKVNPDRVVNITVVAENQGTETETFNVTAYYDSTSIETQNVTDLASGVNTTLLFVWNTTGVSEGTYTIKAVADTVPGETETADNTFIDDTVTIVKPTVYVSPASIIGPPPNITDTFTIDINVSDVVDLYAWQAGMTFNPSVLQCINFTEGPFLKDWAQSFPPPNNETVWMSGTINNTAGVITYHAASLTGYIPGASGNGTLGTIAFQVIDYGNSTLQLTDVILLDSNETAIPRNVVDGYFELPPPLQPPVASFTYSPLTPYTNETVTFNATDSYDPDGSIVNYTWDFGDGTNGTGEITTHVYTNDGNYTVTLNVTDNDALSDTTSANVTVLNRPPVASFTESAETVDTGEVIYFNASDSYDPDGSIVSYFWDFGDGTNATGVTADHFYADNGTYTVTLTVTDDDGATASANATKTVGNRPPVAIFTESAETVLTGEVIYFNASDSYDPDGTIISYFWDFGDGTNTTGAIVNHSYADDGNYTVTLTVTDDDGATNSTSATKIVLNRPPVASFTESAESVLTGEVIYFNASASYDPDGSIVSYFWDFGDGTNATGVTTDHSYADNGTYTVTLTVTDDDGATGSANATKIVGNRPPIAVFTESAEIVDTGEVIYFNASDSYDPDGSIVSYFWDFGDGTNATGVTADHFYADNGTYTVTLTVTDDDGATNSTSATKTVLNRPPVAIFTESAETVLTDEVIYFNASDSYDPDGSIVSYFWDFGDGTNATGVTTDHSYTQEGTYTVTLTVTDDDGATGSANATKIVGNRPPIAVFTESAETVYTNDTISFNASASYDPDGTIVSYFWDFGDGTNATGAIVDHSYADDGNYTVTLTVTDDDGATNSTSATKTVLNRLPVAIFTESAETVDTGEVIYFNASDSYDPDGSIVSYFWDFGDGTNATGAIVNHSYADNGTYTVTLTVTDDDGATGTSTSTKTILNRPPVASFTESAETVLTGEVIYFNASDSYDPDGYIVSYFWDFGDGTNATGVIADHAYTDNGTYTVTLTITDDDGATASTNATKIVGNRSPVAIFTESAETVYTDETITFNASSSYDLDGSIVSYFWDFGDGSNATGMIVTHAYVDNGTYTATLTVTDDDGATNSTSAIKTVLNRPPVAIFTESAETVLVGEVIYFNASQSYDPDGYIVSYFWDFGDGTNATGVTVEHAYADDGIYTVTLTVTDDDGATASASATKTVAITPPVAIFTESAETVYTGEAITFNASASYDPDGTIVSYFWDFGDGTNATGAIVNHSYADDGNYTVTLTVTDDDGATNSTSAIKTVLNRSPVAIFTESATTVPTGEIITFNASQSYDPDGYIVSYFWDFGDGTNATGVVVDHSYADDGVYTVTLTVTDDDGATDTTTSTKTILNRPPVASFTESAETVYTGEAITFNASASYDPDGTIVSYFWDFGDGTNATGVTADHFYADNGTYTVTLTVTDDDGATASANATKTVLNRPPVASFSESAETVDTSEVIYFNASDSYDPDGTIVNYFWDFGDGTNATGVIADHAYTDNGTYTVTLTVTDDDGATNSTSATKTVLNRPPVASFTESAETVDTDEVIYFNASASYDPDGSIVSYFWDFGDGTNATGVTADHFYVDNGTYTVILTVTDDDGATNSTSATKTVLNRLPVAVFTESAETVDTGEVIYFNASDSYDPDGSIVSYFWDFGDGTNATGVTADHFYVDNGTYTVTLTVTDDDGATNSTSATKTVLNRPPVAIFTESAETVLVGEVIYFNASQSYDPDGYIVSYFWDFGDGTNATGVTVEHAYADDGIYTVTLTVTDDDGATASTSATKTVAITPPVAIFTESAETVYTGEVITFNASASYDPDGYIVSYFWDFGDGTNTTGVTVSHSYADDGNYTVTLTVTDDDGATNSTSATKTVLNRLPVAIFTESAETVDTGEVIYFNASDSYDPDGLIVSYFWDFSDGTNATGVTVNHAYADNGTYTVTLTVTDDDGATDTATSTKYILNRPPVASFTESAETVYTGDTISFNASASYDPDGSIVNYFWDFGDGTNTTGVIVNHSYADDGNYMVTLTVTDDDGATNSTSATKTVLNRLPVAIFTESAETVLTGEVIYFNASDSYDPDGYIVSYFWDFGDGTNATGVTAEHAYVEAGNFTVTLTVTDDDGATDTATSTKTVIYVAPDVAVLSVVLSATEAYPTWVVPINITVVVENQGTLTETFNVTAYYNETAIETKTVTLAAGANTTLIFSWNLTGVSPGNYTIKAEASVLPGETDIVDNILIDGTVKLKLPGDANDDGILNVYDLAILGKAWQTSVGDPDYDPRADFNGDGTINEEDEEILQLYWP